MGRSSYYEHSTSSVSASSMTHDMSVEKMMLDTSITTSWPVAIGEVPRQQSNATKHRRRSLNDDVKWLERNSHGRYKTELCRPYEEHGYCKYGSRCQFAHGKDEMRQTTRHPKYKTIMCRSFHVDGFCSYGSRCNFLHDNDERQTSTSAQRISSFVNLDRQRQLSKLSTNSIPNQHSTSSPSLIFNQKPSQFSSPVIDLSDQIASPINSSQHASKQQYISPIFNNYNRQLSSLSVDRLQQVLSSSLLNARQGGSMVPLRVSLSDDLSDCTSVSPVSSTRSCSSTSSDSDVFINDLVADLVSMWNSWNKL